MARRVGHEPELPVSPRRSLRTAFQKQLKGKDCPACGKTIALGIFRSHFDNCNTEIDADECMITQIVTLSQKIGPPILLDDDDDVKPSTSTPIHLPVQPPIKLSPPSTAVKRRSARLTQQRQEPDVGDEKPAIKKLRRATTEVAQVRLTRENVLLLESGSLEPLDKVVDSAVDLGFNCISRRSPKYKESSSPPHTPTKEQTVPEINANTASSEIELAQFEKYTVKFLNKMLQKVINTKDSKYGAEFWGEQFSWFTDYHRLRVKEKELFLTLFLRRRQWFSFIQLKNRYTTYPELPATIAQLKNSGFIEDGSNVMDLDELMSVSGIDVLQNVAKLFRVEYRQARDKLIAALKRHSTSQSDLFGRSKGVSSRMVATFLKELGGCFRISKAADIPFKAIFTLYSPVETNSALIHDDPKKNLEGELLFAMLNRSNDKIKYPAPDDCPKLLSIYRDFEYLKEYIEAKELEIAVARAVYCHKPEKAIELEKEARHQLTLTDLDYPRSFPPSLRRFTAPTVYLRTLSHIASALEKMKMHADAIILQRFLLYHKAGAHFCTDTRGALWERLALNLECHLKLPDEALDELREALVDPFVKEKDKVNLQDRAVKLTKGQFKLVIDISKPREMRITGAILRKNLGDARQNRFIIGGIDGSVTECSVEEISRQYYLMNENMTNGVHAEGSIWHTIFGLIFYDIIFNHDIPDTWFSDIQTHPVDLNYPEFYENRKNSFHDRLKWLLHATEECLREEVKNTWEKHFEKQNTEIAWNLFSNVDECNDFIGCCPRKALAGIFDRLIKDYRNTRSGFPDLTMWNPAAGTLALIEVKGPGDRLSSKQRLWLQYFSGLGLRAEVCYVQADRGNTINI